MPLILAMLVVAVSVLTDGRFASIDNLVNVARQVSFEGMIAFGMTLVIVTGGIDLSVGSLVALTGVVAAVVDPYVNGVHVSLLEHSEITPAEESLAERCLHEGPGGLTKNELAELL